MLIGATGVILLIFLFVKIGIVVGAKHGIPYLWQLTVAFYFLSGKNGIFDDSYEANHCESLLKLEKHHIGGTLEGKIKSRELCQKGIVSCSFICIE